MKIAILDLDVAQAKSMCEILARKNLQCHPFTSLQEFSEQFFKGSYNALIFNLHHLVEDRKIVQEVRSKTPAFFPIFSIAGVHDEDKVLEALAAGINDYLLRPIRRVELRTRISILLRQAYPSQIANDKFTIGIYSFDLDEYRVTLLGKPINLTKKEFELALLLFRNSGRPVSRATIVDAVWQGIAPDLSRTIDTHVSRVRSKLKLVPEHGYCLSPVYSYGYRLDEVTAHDAH